MPAKQTIKVKTTVTKTKTPKASNTSNKGGSKRCTKCGRYM